MSLLTKAAPEEIERLLDLYPLSSLREWWPKLKGESKHKICSTVAAQRNASDIGEFLDGHFSCCKQHIYVCSHGTTLKDVPEIHLNSGAKLWERQEKTEKQSGHLVRVTFTVFLSNPLSEKKIDFLWPVSLQWTSSQLIVRFITLERDIGTYMGGGTALRTQRDIDERSVLKEIGGALKVVLSATDLHKGMKKLWSDDFMDAHKVQFKKPYSTASESMHEKKGIKHAYPDLYKEIIKTHVNSAVFDVLPQQNGSSVTALTIEPNEGYITFPRFSEQAGDTDHVVREILKHN